MAAPFTDLTNECAKHRTPSPNAPPAPRFNRQHSPWTAARTKKKTRSVAPVAMLSEDLPGSTSCHSPGKPITRQSIQAEDAIVFCQQNGQFAAAAHMHVHAASCLLVSSVVFDADVTSKSAFLGDDDTLIGQFGAFSVQTPSPAATSKTSSSSHSSPALDRNDQAELHPAKAYIVHMQASPAWSQFPSGFAVGSENSIGLILWQLSQLCPGPNAGCFHQRTAAKKWQEQ